MNTNDSSNVLALIAGPTASGKSALALRLAECANGVVINADASQLYRDLRVLSARPSEAEEARAPHRLFGVRDGADPCSAAEWAALARAEVEEAHRTGRLPILVGGTGLYIRTLLDGIAPVPPIDPEIRDAVRAMPVDVAWAALQQEDALAAAKLRPSDSQRVARALEVVRSTGRSLRDWQAEREGGIGDQVRLAPLILLPPRDWLTARADGRFVTMLDEGAVDEVDALVARNLSPELPVMRAIGVREIARWRAGEIDRETMIATASIATRQYAKRQYTWFAHQPPAAWERIMTPIDDAILDQCATKLQKMPLTA